MRAGSSTRFRQHDDHVVCNWSLEEIRSRLNAAPKARKGEQHARRDSFYRPLLERKHRADAVHETAPSIEYHATALSDPALGAVATDDRVLDIEAAITARLAAFGKDRINPRQILGMHDVAPLDQVRGCVCRQANQRLERGVASDLVDQRVPRLET